MTKVSLLLRYEDQRQSCCYFKLKTRSSQELNFLILMVTKLGVEEAHMKTKLKIGTKVKVAIT